MFECRVSIHSVEAFCVASLPCGRLAGTGAPITVDTAGSTFATMVGVYESDGEMVGAQVDCVDDIDDSLEARITFETASDASYLIQTGGFAGGTGDLNVSVYE